MGSTRHATSASAWYRGSQTRLCLSPAFLLSVEIDKSIQFHLTIGRGNTRQASSVTRLAFRHFALAVDIGYNAGMSFDGDYLECA